MFLIGEFCALQFNVRIDVSLFLPFYIRFVPSILGSLPFLPPHREIKYLAVLSSFKYIYLLLLWFV